MPDKFKSDKVHCPKCGFPYKEIYAKGELDGFE